MKKLYFLSIALLVGALSFAQTTNLLFSKYGEGSSNNKFLEIYNGTGNNVDLSNYSLSSCSGGCDTAGEFDFPDTLTFAAGTMLNDGDVYIIAHPSADQSILDASDVTFNFLSNGDDAFALTVAGATAANYTIIDIIGDLQGDPGAGWEVAGIANGTQNRTLTRKSTICSPNATPLGSFGTDAATSEWIVGDSNSGWETLGSFSGCVTTPIVTITSPANNAALMAGTTSVNVDFNADNAPAMATFNVSVTINNGTPTITNDATSPFAINGLNDGDTVAVTVELFDNAVLASDTTNFSIAYPCDLQIGTITRTCDAITPAATDTYNVSIAYTGGATSTYTINTNGVGTVGGDNPSTTAMGTITITGITEATDFTVTFTGDAANSSCNFVRNINSPDCNPQLTLPLSEPFDYADGFLTANPNWTDYSGTALQMTVNSGEVTVLQDNSQSEDARIAFASAGGGDIYYGIDFRVPNPGAPITGGDYEYFAALKDANFGLRARLDIVEANTASNDFTVGLSTATSTADVVWTTDLDFDTTYRATVRYNQDTNIAELWIDALMENQTSVTSADEDDPGISITQFALRQSNSSTDESIIVDNLKIATTFAETLSTGSQNALTQTNFTVYPNPTKTGLVTINTASNTTIFVSIYDVLGKQIHQSSVTNNSLDLSHLKSGIYLLQLSQNNGATATRKLIIE